MNRIRLTRLGKKKKPFYRIIVIDSRCKRDGKYIECLGTYDPMSIGERKDKFKINIDRYNHWLKLGAQPSEIVKRGFLLHQV